MYSLIIGSHSCQKYSTKLKRQKMAKFLLRDSYKVQIKSSLTFYDGTCELSPPEHSDEAAWKIEIILTRIL